MTRVVTGVMKRRAFLAALGGAAGAAAVARVAGAQTGAQSSAQPGTQAAPPSSPLSFGTPAQPAPGGAPGSAPAESPTPSQITGAPITAPETPGATMEGEGYRPVRRSAKPGARPLLTADARDALEHQLSCPCPCTLDVYTCRTSMSCGFSPAMHKDVVALVDGGYSGDEILAAFVQSYGTEVLMAPPKVGFNLAGYFAPAAVLGTGTVALAALMRRWSTRAHAAARARSASHPPSAQPTPASTARAGRGDPVSYSASDAAALGATPDELARLEAAVRGESP